MITNIPNIILNDAAERGFIRAIFAGEVDNILYFYYVRDSSTRYSGLPAIVKIIDGKIEDVTCLAERLRAYDYAIANDK